MGGEGFGGLWGEGEGVGEFCGGGWEGMVGGLWVGVGVVEAL